MANSWTAELKISIVNTEHASFINIHLEQGLVLTAGFI